MTKSWAWTGHPLLESSRSRHSVAGAAYTGSCAAARLPEDPREVADMKSLAGLRLVVAAAIAVGARAAALAQSQPLKPQPPRNWRHGIIEAKSDAGILFVASRRDFAATLGL